MKKWSTQLKTTNINLAIIAIKETKNWSKFHFLNLLKINSKNNFLNFLQLTTFCQPYSTRQGIIKQFYNCAAFQAIFFNCRKIEVIISPLKKWIFWSSRIWKKLQAKKCENAQSILSVNKIWLFDEKHFNHWVKDAINQYRLRHQLS